MSFRASLVAAALAVMAAGPAAAIFDDNEARKAIVDLRGVVRANDDAAKARSAEAAAANAALMQQITALLEQSAALRRSLLELNNQIEAMRGEQATLRGSNEQLAREVAELQRRSRDVGQTLDDRLRRLEPVKVSVDGREFLADPEEKRLHDEAMAVLRGGDFDRASASLSAFLRRYPASGYADSVRFWLGNALYGKRDYKGAIDAFRGFVVASPAHARAPEAMLALANSQAEMKDPKGARKTIDDLLKTYPASEAAQAGKDRLASLPR